MTVSGKHSSESKISKLMDTLIVKPFIECLQLLVSKGANPNARVEKLKMHRVLDEKRAKLKKKDEIATHDAIVKDI